MLNLFQRTLDVPFEKDTSNMFIPWITGMMVFLATLALISANSVSAMMKGWDNSHKNSIVIEILPGNYSKPYKVRKEGVLSFLQQSPLVRSFKEITTTDLGSTAEDLQFLQPMLPVLIDVHMVNGAEHKWPAFEKQLNEIFHGVQIQDQSKWAHGAVKVGETIIVVSLVIATLIALAAIATIAFVTQTGLKAHDRVIDILQLVGAHDDYVAGQFQAHALILGFKGAAIGLILSTAALLSLSFLVADINIPHFQDCFSYSETVLIAILTPFIGVFLMSFSARLTVLSALGRKF